MKGFFQLCHLTGDFPHQMSNSLIVDLLMTKTRIIWPDPAQIKECAEIFREGQSAMSKRQKSNIY
jgi:hypothetical protein